MAERPAAVQAMRAIVGDSHVLVGAAEQSKYLQDNSWLSPVLSRYLAETGQQQASVQGVDAVVSPANDEQLVQVVGTAVRFGIPITLRGGGTSNFGQSLALQGGVVLDTTRLNRVLDVGDNHVTAEAGALCGEMDRQARRLGRDMTLLTTTYATATIGGWIGGGHVGIGSTAYGTIWDGNVTEVEVLTAQDPPQRITLRGEDAFPLLHSYGTVGVIVKATVPLVPARDWVEGVAVFSDFMDACRFVVDTGQEPLADQRAVAAQEAPVPASFTPWERLVAAADSAVPLIVDRSLWDRLARLAAQYRGTLLPWKTEADPQKLSLTYFVYGHRMLWVKRIAPEAAFLHVYYHPRRILEQLSALKRQFAERVWLEFKFINSAYLKSLFGWSEPGPIAAGVLTVTGNDPALLTNVMSFCEAVGIPYWNPHTFVLEESGLFSEAGFAKVVAFKQRTDPRQLLNPGKIGGRFFDAESGPS